MPLDPRDAIGACGGGSPFVPPLKPYQLGEGNAGDVPQATFDNLAWPPLDINRAGLIAEVPQYTPTGPIVTLPGPTMTGASGSAPSATPDVGSGWANPADNAGMMVEIPGCTYLDPWVGPLNPVPAPLCQAGSGPGAAAAAPAPARRDGAAAPAITTPPSA